MNKKTVKKVLWGIGALAVLGALFYSSARNVSPAGTALDPHGHQVPVSAPTASLDNLLNKPSPEFSFSDGEGNVYTSDNLRGKDVVLFFNEGLMCYPACWNQIASFSKDLRFAGENTVVLSVIADPQKDWLRAVEEMPELGAATVVFDTGASVSAKFGVLWTPSSMHPGSLPGHTYVLIDKSGVVRSVLDDPRMGINNDVLLAQISNSKE